MFHHVAHAVPGRRLFSSWEEALALWTFLRRHLQGVVAMVLMPDHVHVITRTDQHAGLVEAVRAYARWQAWRGWPGPLWAQVPPADLLPDRLHQRRTLRYLYLNPCRARLVGCPVAWPFSTYRDALGLAADPLVRRHPDPVRLHAYVSADPSAAVEGTPFPGSVLRSDRPPLPVIAGAVSEWKRQPLADLLAGRPGRRLVTAAARALTTWPATQIAELVGAHRSSVHRTPALPVTQAQVVATLAADPRTPGLVLRDPRLPR